MNIKIQPLTFIKKTFKSKEGKDIEYAETVASYEGQIYKFSVGKDVDLTTKINTLVEVELSINPDFQMKPKIKIVSVL